MFCKHPHTGVTIGPDGSVNVCCINMMWEGKIANLKDIDNLTTLYNESELLNLMRQGDTETINTVCHNCINRERQGFTSRRQRYNENNYACDDKIRYLEITTSNICNQTCSTCRSLFSSKWKELDDEANKLFSFRSPGRDTFRMPQSDIQKVIDVLDDLECLCIKGGEPFADKDNFEILKRLSEVNPECNIIITSNLAKIPNIFMPVLKKFNNIEISASIDGVGDVYEWIRSSPFEQTVNTMEKLYAETGITVSIAVTMSLYNAYRLWDIVEYFVDCEYANSINFVKFIDGPYYNIADIIPVSERVNIVNAFKNKIDSLSDIQKSKVIADAIYNFPNANNSDKVNLEHTKQWIDYMNGVRNMNLYECIPELKKVLL